MMDEKQRLLTMLNEQKISKTDFEILSAALDKRSTRLMSTVCFLVNPFQKIAGVQSLLIGIAIILLTSYLGFHAQQYYVNIMETTNVSANANPRVPYTFWLVLYQLVVCYLSLSLCYLFFAKIFKIKGLRVMDFFGMVAMSWFPLLINAVILLLTQYFSPTFLYLRDTQLQSSWLEMIFSFQNMFLGLWQFILYFNALKMASGLTGNKLWISVAASFVIASVVGSELTMFFV